MQQYFDTLSDISGNSLLGATVTVTDYPAGTLATIYSANGTASPIANSVVAADITGQVSFYAPDGDYTLTYVFKGTTYKVRSPVGMLDPMGFVTIADSGSVNAYVVTDSRLPAQLYAGLKASFKATHTNTGAVTLNVNSTGAQPMKMADGTDPVAGIIVTGGVFRVEWDGAKWQLVSVLDLTQAIIGTLLFPRTGSEITAGVIPTNTAIPSHDALGEVLTQRYGVVGDGTVDDTTALRNAMLVAMQADAVLRLQPTVNAVGIKVTGVLAITSSIAIMGSGYFGSAILNTGSTDVFQISAGANSVRLENFAIAMAVPYTTTPNAAVAIASLGTTATPCVYHTYRDLFIDGFGTPISARALQDSTIDNVFTAHGKNGIIAAQLSVAVNVSNCLLTGGLVAGSYGIQVGDNNAAAEGWNVTNCTIYGFDIGIAASGSQNHQISNCQFDHITNIGIYLDGTTVAATNCTITGNFFGMFGSGATAIYLHGVAAPSVQLGCRITGNMFSNYATKTLTYGILIDGANDIGHVIVGNSSRATTFDCRINAGSGIIVAANNWLGPGYYGAVAVTYADSNVGTIIAIPAAAVVASAANITLPNNDSVVTISGTTNITSITAVRPRGPVTLIFQSTPTVTDGSNLKMAGNFVATADDALTLVCDGTNWYEVARSVN